MIDKSKKNVSNKNRLVNKRVVLKPSNNVESVNRSVQSHQKRQVVGKVVSDKMLQTVVVLVERFVTHPLYKKRMYKSKKYHAHNQIGAKIDNIVRLQETKPVSKTKHWTVIEIMKD